MTKSHFSLQLVTAFGFPYSNNFSKFFQIIWSLFPPNLLAKALSLLSDATSNPGDPGISWSRRTECAPNDTECVITIVCYQFNANSIDYRPCAGHNKTSNLTFFFGFLVLTEWYLYMACGDILLMVFLGDLPWQHYPKCSRCEKISLLLFEARILDRERRK